MTRNHTIPASCLLAFLALNGCQRAPEPADHVARPNVLFISVDDLNDWVGVLGGHPQARTPHLDELADRGVLFTNAHTAAPACNPSRAALLSGRRPSRTGVYNNLQPWRRAMPDAVTLPRYFKDHGYYVLGGGKIFHEGFPDPGAWHEYVLAPTGGFNGDPVPPDRGKNELMGPLLGVADTAMGDWKTTSWAIAQLQRDFDRPFFMACGIFRPHLPWFVPEMYFEPFPAEGIQLPYVPTDDLDDIPDAGLGMRRIWNVTTDDQRRSAVQAYLASVSFADAQLGRLLKALHNSRYADNTIVVFWSDNGLHLGEKENWRKFTLWEESTRVPLVFIVPKGVVGLPRGASPGERSSRPVNLVDVYPTLVELAGLPPNSDLDGLSLAPLLKDPAMEWLTPSITTWGRNNHAVRSERYRYIRYDDGSEELYDHQTDPDEFANLASDDAYAEIIAEHRRWIPEVNAPNAQNRSQGLWSRLRRLLRL